MPNKCPFYTTPCNNAWCKYANGESMYPFIKRIRHATMSYYGKCLDRIKYSTTISTQLVGTDDEYVIDDLVIGADYVTFKGHNVPLNKDEITNLIEKAEERRQYLYKNAKELTLKEL